MEQHIAPDPSEMDPGVREALGDLLQQWGVSALDDPAEFSARLRERISTRRRELFALLAALEAGTPRELRAVPVATAREAIARLSSSLAAETALAPEAAWWAVESWWAALQRVDAGAGDVKSAPEPAVARSAASGPQPGTVSKPEEPARGIPSQPAPIALEQVEQRLREARLYWRRGQHESARTALEEILQRVPDHTAAIEMLGDLHAERGDLDDAIAAYRRGGGELPPHLEEKLARVLVLKEEAERERLVEQLGLSGAASPVDRKRRVMLIALGVIAALLVFSIWLVDWMLAGVMQERRRMRRP
jgi:tetratricopeptide (TPR) repeat protein